jgi:uncharacterized protein YyaL (SSP411 family)
MNRLQHESSPYLQQHATNPVDWYPWKEEAFQRAREEDKPILVSIGYSTCHWCHVMEKESFEDPDIAAYMNEHFINIKVDREERPDVDQIYMEACQVISGNGGWPLNCFLTPDRRPFFAGTYYPPRPAYNRPSWKQLLLNMHHVYQDRRQDVEDQADRLMEVIRSSDSTFLKDNLAEQAETAVNDQFLQQIYSRIGEQMDMQDGGIGGAPKFPATMTLDYLLQYGRELGDAASIEHVHFSLEKMIRGGIYDQLGGGFARYATDRAWLIPHFEKMLYDNALLVGLLADAYRQKPSELYRQAIEETLGFIRREMTHSEGGFYAALDADSEGEEGKFYVWQAGEIRDELGEEAELFMDYYGVSEEGNWEGKNILWRPIELSTFTEQKGLTASVCQEKLAAAREKLLTVRARRVRPGRDEKVLLGWNALMTSAYAKAFQALGHPEYLEAAERNLSFIWKAFVRPGHIGFFHTYKDGAAQYDAFLDDYAFLIEALWEVYSITFREEYLERARELTDYVLDHFHDPQTGLFFFTALGQQDIPVRRRDLYDSATPSGNSTMLRNLQRLGVLFDQEDYRKQADDMLGRIQDAVGKYPASFGRWAIGMLRAVRGSAEIAVVGPDFLELSHSLQRLYIPGAVWMAAGNDHDQYPLLKGKQAGERTRIFLCKDYACRQPVETKEAFEQLVAR